MSRSARAISLPLMLAESACAGYSGQSALDPAGPEAAAIRQLFEFMLPAAGGVFVLVVAALALVGRRGPRPDPEARSSSRETAARRVVTLAIVASTVLAFVVLVYDFSVAGTLTHRGSPSALTVHITGHQWWWEVEYEDSIPQNRVRLANEIHLPVGRPVLLKLDSHDVIHSFWAPNLAGKKDLIPGHHTALWVRADTPGVYRGQCAEFCGTEHAKMALVVVAEPPEKFAAWMGDQRKPPVPPGTALAARGRFVFEAGTCGTCHTVTSTGAAGRVGPDLTHVASRRTLAAGTLPNTRGNLAGWIRDPQSIKPGAQMPPQALSPQDLHALVAYLETLR